MGFRPEPAPWLRNEALRPRTAERLAESARIARNLLGSLPKQRDLLLRVQKYGLQKV